MKLRRLSYGFSLWLGRCNKPPIFKMTPTYTYEEAIALMLILDEDGLIIFNKVLADEEGMYEEAEFNILLCELQGAIEYERLKRMLNDNLDN